VSNSLPLGSILVRAVLHKELVRPASDKLLGLFLVLLLASPAAQAADAGAKEKELRELRGRIEALQKRLADAEGTKSEAADALKESACIRRRSTGSLPGSTPRRAAARRSCVNSRRCWRACSTSIISADSPSR